ncbi:thioredoxin domain-containing protein [Prolixibacter bellariivorans]|uniref:thioredoxin domain-containing protein n=1 Tax=Prolixibacter bellariivorans TaxID=314319 RepID=UPI0035711ACF
MLVACHNNREPKPVTLKNTVSEKPEDVVFGNKAAPATVFLYASYECTYCRYFFRPDLPGIKEELPGHW